MSNLPSWETTKAVENLTDEGARIALDAYKLATELDAKLYGGGHVHKPGLARKYANFASMSAQLANQYLSRCRLFLKYALEGKDNWALETEGRALKKHLEKFSGVSISRGKSRKKKPGPTKKKVIRKKTTGQKKRVVKRKKKPSAKNPNKKKIVRLTDRPTGGYGLSADSLDYIDESGPSYRTKRAAIRAAQTSEHEYTHYMSLKGNLYPLQKPQRKRKRSERTATFRKKQFTLTTGTIGFPAAIKNRTLKTETLYRGTSGGKIYAVWVSQLTGKVTGTAYLEKTAVKTKRTAPKRKKTKPKARKKR